MLLVIKNTMLRSASILRGLFAYDKSDPAFFGWRGRHELADCFENYVNLFVVCADFALQRRQLSGKLTVGGQQTAHTNKRTHYQNAHFNGWRAVQDVGHHERPMLGEGIGEKTRIAVLLRTGRNLRPVARAV